MESDVGICKEGECLTGEAVSVLFDVSLGHYGEFLPRDRTRCRDTKHNVSQKHRQPTTTSAYKILCMIKNGINILINPSTIKHLNNAIQRSCT